MFWGKNIKGGETIELDVNNMEGKILKVKITWADKYSLRGELV